MADLDDNDWMPPETSEATRKLQEALDKMSRPPGWSSTALDRVRQLQAEIGPKMDLEQRYPGLRDALQGLKGLRRSLRSRKKMKPAPAPVEPIAPDIRGGRPGHLSKKQIEDSRRLLTEKRPDLFADGQIMEGQAQVAVRYLRRQKHLGIDPEIRDRTIRRKVFGLT